MPPDRWITITGVVANHKWERMSEEPKGALYLPITQSSPTTVRVVVRVNGADQAAAGAAVREAVRAIDADIPVDTLVSLDGLVRQSAGASRFLAVVFSAFGLVGLLLGALGIFGVTSDAVARARHEIAVRLAIGAEPPSIVRLVVGQSLALAGVGIAGGLGVAWVGSSALAGALFETSATDPLIYGLVALGLAVIAGLSCYWPARRASRISPLEALRGA
jgi:putative ABC transport system permease protein